jgi:hypothetical protein
LNYLHPLYRFRFVFILFLINVICFSALFAQQGNQNFIFEGKVIDSVTYKPLVGVTVISLHNQNTTTSDAEGIFRLKVPAGYNNIRFSAIGYSTKTAEINFVSNINRTIALSSDVRQLKEVTITAQGSKQRLEDVNSGTFQINRKEIGNLPVLFGETDFFKALQLMPGVQTSGEGNAAIYVRGGGYDQNMILLDEATVYNPTHLLGFYSVFNTDIISSVKVIKAGIPAEYGNRLSSVIEFKTKQDAPDRFTVKGNINLLSTRLGVDIPIHPKVFVSLAARKTYLNSWLDVLRKTDVIKPRSILYKTGYDFYDVNGTVNAQINAKNKILISLYTGKDIFQLNAPAVELNTNMDWGNKIGSFTWYKIFTQNFYMENSLIYSGYNFDMDLKQSQYKLNLVSKINDYGFKNKFIWLVPHHKINFGISAIHHTIVPNTSKAASDSVQLNIGAVNRYYSVESGLFVSDEVAVSDRFSIYFGLRFNSFDHLGDYFEYVYDDLGNIIDTLRYKKWEHIRNYSSCDIRASLRYLIRDNLSVKLSFNSNNQYLHLVNASSITFPTDFWISSSGKVKPQKGFQWAAGVLHVNNKLNIEASVEMYYKTLTHQVEFYKGIFNAMDNSAFDDNLVFGKGRAYGVEFLIRKTQGKITGWVGYTLSRTEKSFAAIENGRWFPAKYDRPNDLSVVVSYSANKKWSFSTVFVYANGSTYTPVVGRYIMANNIVNEYGRYNSARMPAYHRCDVSATLFLKKTETRESKLIFSVYNVYNRANPLFVYPEVTGDLNHYTLNVSPNEVYIFKILPSIGWEFQF